MASPQKENGYTPIAHTILEALSKHIISPDEWRILMIIFRKTYGWDKKQDRISHTQFSEMTGITRNHIPRIINRLLARNIIYKVSPIQGTGVPYSRDGNIISYGFQKNYDKWLRCPPNRGLSPEQDFGVPCSGPKVSPKQVHTKDTLTKETIQKKETLSNPKIKTFIDFYFQEFKNHFQASPLIQGGKDGKIVQRLLKLIPLEDLKDLILIFFESNDKFIKQSGYTLGVFESQINKLRINTKQAGLKGWAKEIIEEEKNDRPRS